MMNSLMSQDEQLKIAAMIEDYHRVFFTFFEMSVVMFTDSIPTAAVKLRLNSKPELMINEEFWRKLNIREQLFVICHECLHVMLDHGTRNGLNVPGANSKLVNIAQDITINEMIVDLFNYDRNDLREWKKFCWIDTCFEDLTNIKRNETFVYYLEKLIKDPPKEPSDGGPSLFDEHADPSFEGSAEENEAGEKLSNTLAEELSAKEIESLMKNLPAGVLTSTLENIIAKKIKKQKIKFDHIIRKLKKSSMKDEEKDVDTFTHDDRRFSDIVNTRPDITLPGKNAVNRYVRDRLLTAVFMDISGSCSLYFNIFQKVFLAFDEERKIFDTRLFIFDTQVVEIKPGDKIRVGGGTSFDIIESKCRELEAQGHRYPDCVIVITDGYGNNVTPKAPAKWIWLLTPTDSTKQHIPSRSKSFLINQITFDK
jgi:predicted metal-dependent peptidase